MFFSYLGSFNAALAQYAALPPGVGADEVSLNEWVIERYYHALIFMMVFLVPLLTMRAFAEERRRGTFELLLTSPLSVRQIVLGKFGAVAAMTAMMCVLALVFPALLCTIASPEIAPILSGFAGLLLCSWAFASIALAASCYTDNQIVAGVSGVVTLLLLYVIFSPAQSLGEGAQAVLEYLSPVWQVNDMIQGVVPLKAVVYLVSLTVFGLFICQRALEVQRWR